MMKKTRILAILLLFSLLWLVFDSPKPVQAQAGTPAEVIAYINALRASNGLGPLTENIYLDIAAQNHADWIAETGLGGHTGIDGSTAYDRAVAVGYGAGSQAWVTENWARGYNLTASGCVYDMWAPSEAHLDNMLTTWHDEFGVGVALDSSGFTVYVANFGHTSGGDTGQVTSDPNVEITPGGPTVTTEPYVNPIVKSTPAADGTIIHIVQYGQTLYGIAEVYEISITDLLTLNGLTEDSVIYPDEQLVIVQGTGETPTPTVTPEEIVPTATPTQEVTQTVEATQEQMTPTPTVEPKNGGNFLTNLFSGDTLWVGIGLVAVSVFGIALLLFTSARLK
jgi:LysM repeat protein